MTMSLREFKVKQFILINEIEKELMSKYPDKHERIQYIVDILKSKLDHLRIFSLYDYLRTLDLASKEFSEFKRLFPSEKEVRELLESKD